MQRSHWLMVSYESKLLWLKSRRRAASGRSGTLAIGGLDDERGLAVRQDLQVLVDERVVVAADFAGLVACRPEPLGRGALLLGSLRLGQVRAELRRPLERRQRAAGPDALQIRRAIRQARQVRSGGEIGGQESRCSCQRQSHAIPFCMVAEDSRVDSLRGVQKMHRAHRRSGCRIAVPNLPSSLRREDPARQQVVIAARLPGEGYAALFSLFDDAVICVGEDGDVELRRRRLQRAQEFERRRGRRLGVLACNDPEHRRAHPPQRCLRVVVENRIEAERCAQLLELIVRRAHAAVR